MSKVEFSWDEIRLLLADLAVKIPKGASVFGVPRGGAIVAGMLAIGHGVSIAADEQSADVIVDDIIDSGATMKRLAKGRPFLALVDKLGADTFSGRWIVFPWEHRDVSADIEDTVIRQLQAIGEDPTREGLRDTPRRYLGAMKEMTRGMHMDAAAPLARTFSEDHDEVVCVSGINFDSLCEHHLLGFGGTVDFAYIPRGKVVGLSKIPRMIGILAARLQVQERLTTQIAGTFSDALNPRGVMVVIRSTHSCMRCRGVRSQGQMVTSVVRGLFKTDHISRAEALDLMRRTDR